MPFRSAALSILFGLAGVSVAWGYDPIDCVNAVSHLPAEPLPPVERGGVLEDQTLFRSAEDRSAGKPGILVTRARAPDRFEVNEWPDSTGPRKSDESPELFAHFHVARGELSFEIKVNARNGARAVLLDPETLFKTALAHFGGRVQSIKTRFWRGTPEMDRFLAARAAGPRRAALKTWAGEQASAAGFTRVEVPFETQTKLQAFGTHGEPEQLTFRFLRPDKD